MVKVKTVQIYAWKGKCVWPIYSYPSSSMEKVSKSKTQIIVFPVQGPRNSLQDVPQGEEEATPRRDQRFKEEATSILFSESPAILFHHKIFFLLILPMISFSTVPGVDWVQAQVLQRVSHRQLPCLRRHLLHGDCQPWAAGGDPEVSGDVKVKVVRKASTVLSK